MDNTRPLTFEEMHEYLVNEVRTRGGFAAGDSRTFLWAKTQKDFWRSVEPLHLGGGNFTIALNCLAVLSFLGAIYALCESDKPRLFTQKERDFIKKLKKEHSEFREFFILPKVDEWYIPNEREMIWGLLSKSGANLGIDERHFETIWRAYRNKLVHTFGPAVFFPVSSEGEGIKGVDAYQLFAALSEIDEPVFINHQNGKGYILNAEMLLRDTIKATKWLTDHINDYSTEDMESVARAVDWLAKQTVEVIELK